jgi:hypothetical protein
LAISTSVFAFVVPKADRPQKARTRDPKFVVIFDRKREETDCCIMVPRLIVRAWKYHLMQHREPLVWHL